MAWKKKVLVASFLIVLGFVTAKIGDDCELIVRGKGFFKRVFRPPMMEICASKGEVELLFRWITLSLQTRTIDINSDCFIATTGSDIPITETSNIGK